MSSLRWQTGTFDSKEQRLKVLNLDNFVSALERIEISTVIQQFKTKNKVYALGGLCSTSFVINKKIIFHHKYLA